MSKRKQEQWILAVELWRSGAVVTDFMRDQLAGLRDADGDLLPEAVGKFLDDLVFCRIKPKPGRPVGKTAIRAAYAERLFFEQMNSSALRGSTPSERAIASLAKELHLSDGAVSLIVHPRKSRQR
jgi:hypothetical protein